MFLQLPSSTRLERCEQNSRRQQQQQHKVCVVGLMRRLNIPRFSTPDEQERHIRRKRQPNATVFPELPPAQCPLLLLEWNDMLLRERCAEVLLLSRTNSKWLVANENTHLFPVNICDAFWWKPSESLCKNLQSLEQSAVLLRELGLYSREK